MAQSQKGTTQGMGECGKFFAGEASTAPTIIACVTGTNTTLSTGCSSAASSMVYANEIFSSANGASMQTATAKLSTQTDNANDTLRLDKLFTATGAVMVLGFAAINTDKDVMYAICCYASAVTLASSDTLLNSMSIEFVCT